jgi:hypothetical protein
MNLPSLAALATGSLAPLVAAEFAGSAVALAGNASFAENFPYD